MKRHDFWPGAKSVYNLCFALVPHVDQDKAGKAVPDAVRIKCSVPAPDCPVRS
ncbi:hypothetical protein [Ruegeria arenilitoris]|uniref:hypothetical protein n=1 Tax=Ruegeria arenilitoris TaxID=1173585 RepID=UPI0014803C6F|nr:hypothetical protein [Ruegeria arenilitoris]